MTPEIEKALAALHAAIARALAESESRHAETAQKLQQITALLGIDKPKRKRGPNKAKA